MSPAAVGQSLSPGRWGNRSRPEWRRGSRRVPVGKPYPRGRYMGWSPERRRLRRPGRRRDAPGCADRAERRSICRCKPPVDDTPPAASAPPATADHSGSASSNDRRSWSWAGIVAASRRVPACCLTLPAYGSDLRPPSRRRLPVPSVPAATGLGGARRTFGGIIPVGGRPLWFHRWNGRQPGPRPGRRARTHPAWSAHQHCLRQPARPPVRHPMGGRAAAATAARRCGGPSGAATSWAAGLRDDGTTSLLVTDLAGGWIPPQSDYPPT